MPSLVVIDVFALEQSSLHIEYEVRRPSVVWWYASRLFSLMFLSWGVHNPCHFVMLKIQILITSQCFESSLLSKLFAFNLFKLQIKTLAIRTTWNLSTKLQFKEYKNITVHFLCSHLYLCSPELIREPKQLPRQGWNIKLSVMAMSYELTTQPNICTCMISDRTSEVLEYVCIT